MPTSSRWVLLSERAAWGTRETIDAVVKAIDEVHAEFPRTQPVYIGDISYRAGGQLKKHLSHQAGRDVDIGWYYSDGRPRWYRPATRGNFDRARTWALLRALLTHSDVEMIFIDRPQQLMLHSYALDIGEDPVWLQRVFQHPNGRYDAIVRHSRGHHTHLHVRFYSPRAQEMGRRAYTALLDEGIINPPVRYRRITARRGDSLARLAKRHGTSVAALRRANSLRGNRIIAGRSYRIPVRGRVRPDPRPLVVRPRRVPPPRRAPVVRVDPGQRRGAGRRRRRRASGRARTNDGARWIRVRVRAGDSLWKIARAHGVTVRQLRRWNRLAEGSHLLPGHTLKVWTRSR